VPDALRGEALLLLRREPTGLLPAARKSGQHDQQTKCSPESGHETSLRTVS
jgi:hypothetical protein